MCYLEFEIVNGVEDPADCPVASRGQNAECDVRQEVAPLKPTLGRNVAEVDHLQSIRPKDLSERPINQELELKMQEFRRRSGR